MKRIKERKFLFNMKVELLAYTPNADKLVAAAAKLCYAKSDIVQRRIGKMSYIIGSKKR